MLGHLISRFFFSILDWFFCVYIGQPMGQKWFEPNPIDWWVGLVKLVGSAGP